MEKEQYVIEYLEDNFFEESADESSKNPIHIEGTRPENVVIVKNEVNSVKKAAKRVKSETDGTKKQSASKKAKTEDGKNKGQIIKLYAYKHCLGIYNSLVQNPEMPLWYRDSSFLLQKYLRQSINQNGDLLYYSTRTYSCWEEERANDFMEIEAEVTVNNRQADVVKILNLAKIENECLNGNFSVLDLPPYKSFDSRKGAEKETVEENVQVDDYNEDDDTPSTEQAVSTIQEYL